VENKITFSRVSDAVFDRLRGTAITYKLFRNEKIPGSKGTRFSPDSQLISQKFFEIASHGRTVEGNRKKLYGLSAAFKPEETSSSERLGTAPHDDNDEEEEKEEKRGKPEKPVQKKAAAEKKGPQANGNAKPPAKQEKEQEKPKEANQKGKKEPAKPVKEEEKEKKENPKPKEADQKSKKEPAKPVKEAKKEKEVIAKEKEQPAEVGKKRKRTEAEEKPKKEEAPKQKQEAPKETPKETQKQTTKATSTKPAPKQNQPKAPVAPVPETEESAKKKPKIAPLEIGNLTPSSSPAKQVKGILSPLLTPSGSVKKNVTISLEQNRVKSKCDRSYFVVPQPHSYFSFSFFFFLARVHAEPPSKDCEHDRGELTQREGRPRSVHHPLKNKVLCSI